MRRMFIVVMLMLSSGGALAQDVPISYRGEHTLYRDTVWQGQVEIDGILTVAPGVTLEIRPGSVIRFTAADTNHDDIGEHELFIQGSLQALGTAEQPILFTSAQPVPRPGDWGAINMMATETENRLEHCKIEYAYRGFHAHFSRGSLRHSELSNNVRAAQFQESTVEIDHCRVVNNFNGVQFRNAEVTLTKTLLSGNYWGLRCVYSQVDMEDCTIEGNLVNGMNFRGSEVVLRNNLVRNNRKGIYLQDSQAVVVANHLIGNSEHGILLENTAGTITGNLLTAQGRAGIKLVDSPVDLSGNAIFANGEYALVNDGRGDVAARHNWWGDAIQTAIQIAPLVRDHADRPEVGSVDFSHPLTSRPAVVLER